MRELPVVTLYTRKRCHLCEAAREVIDDVREDHPFELEVFDVDADASLRARYHHDVPVVCVAGEVKFVHRVTAEALTEALAAATRA
ncbi:MAG: glutaredoxin family protein [Polyangiales bacterium]